MATILQPDKTRTETLGEYKISIKEKIIPDSARANKDVASWCKKGQPMKPCLPLGGDGKPRGITVHNTNDITVPSGTTPAEQYIRATWPNQNMAGVVVHFYVHGIDIWQNLKETERGWHATDGQTRRASQRKGQTIGGNLDTVAIECIGSGRDSEDTTARLVAYLLRKYGLSPETDVYQHNYFYPQKSCPQYIRPHWGDFLNLVKKYYDAKDKPAVQQPSQGGTPVAQPQDSAGKFYRVQIGAFTAKSNADALLSRAKAAGFADAYIKFE